MECALARTCVVLASPNLNINGRVAPVCAVSIVDDLQGGVRFGSCTYVVFLSKVLFLGANLDTKGRF